MKRYSMSFGAAIEHKPEYPERTAKKPQGWDVAFQVWPNRPAMAKSIRMQQSRAPHPSDWKPVIQLRDGEGY